MDICRSNQWGFIIRYKTGSIPGIAEEYEQILVKETAGHAEFVNDIDYNGKLVNMLRYYEEKTVKGETVRTEFQWLTNIRITKKNANAMKNHYLMTQISDMVKQLYEWFFLKRHGIRKRQKNISSELLACFDRQLTPEDISIAEDTNVVQLV